MKMLFPPACTPPPAIWISFSAPWWPAYPTRVAGFPWMSPLASQSPCFLAVKRGEDTSRLQQVPSAGLPLPALSDYLLNPPKHLQGLNHYLHFTDGSLEGEGTGIAAQATGCRTLSSLEPSLGGPAGKRPWVDGSSGIIGTGECYGNRLLDVSSA